MANMELTTEEGVKTYLRSNLHPTCHKVERLPEGFGSFVYRAWQEDNAHPATIIAKHSAGYAARAPDWKLDQSRLEYEFLALTLLSQPPFHHPNIRVPLIHHFSQPHHLLLLEDLGPLPSLKSYLSPGIPTTAAAASAIGANLGSYLANLHNQTSNDTSLLSQFAGNKTAKTLSSTLYFTQLPSIAAEQGYSGSHVQAAADQAIHDINDGHEVLTLGDFWTGNVLIDANSSGSENHKLYLIDLELAKPGTADFDVGQMAAELYFIAAFREYAVGMGVLRTFLRAYREMREGKVEVGKVAIRVAAHIFVIGSRYWKADAGEERFKKQLDVADELLRLGVAKDENALRDTIVGDLISQW